MNRDQNLNAMAEAMEIVRKARVDSLNNPNVWAKLSRIGTHLERLHESEMRYQFGG
jgi:hypothetical protein